MNGAISLVESKTFWSAALSLTAIVAAQFHWSSVATFATDPQTVTTILNGVAAVGAVGAVVGRYVATKQVTGIVTAPPVTPATK